MTPIVDSTFKKLEWNLKNEKLGLIEISIRKVDLRVQREEHPALHVCARKPRKVATMKRTMHIIYRTASTCADPCAQRLRIRATDRLAASKIYKTWPRFFTPL